jgi:hypothetical protein
VLQHISPKQPTFTKDRTDILFVLANHPKERDERVILFDEKPDIAIVVPGDRSS